MSRFPSGEIITIEIIAGQTGGGVEYVTGLECQTSASYLSSELEFDALIILFSVF